MHSPPGPGSLRSVDVVFTERADGIIDASVSPELGLFSEALVDSVSSRAPRGARHAGLSTYWIDRTEDAARNAAATGDAQPFAAGNATYLRLEGEMVVANWEWDFDDESGSQALPLNEFLEILAAWRRRVIDSGGVHGSDAALIDRDPPTPRDPAEGTTGR